MLYISKGMEPEFLKEFKKKYPKKNYDSKEFAEYRPVLKKLLIKEQKGLCAYCCGKITEEKAHNEHIEPQHPGKYVSDRSLDYNTIVASCNNLETCGIKKENKYDKEKFLSPLDEKCEETIIYYGNGKISGNDYTIEEVLNLNAYELVNARKAVIKALQYYDKETIEMIYMDKDSEEYAPYYNVIKWYWSTLSD